MDIGEKKYVTTFKGANMRGRRLADLGVCDRKMLKQVLKTYGVNA